MADLSQDTLQRNILTYVAVCTELEPHHLEQYDVYQQMTAALESVLPRQHLVRFTTLANDTKEFQVKVCFDRNRPTCSE